MITWVTNKSQTLISHKVYVVFYFGTYSVTIYLKQGSHFFGLTKFHDISMIFPGFLVNFQVFYHYF